MGAGWVFFFFQAEDGIRGHCVTGVQTCALPICGRQDGDRIRGAGRAEVRPFERIDGDIDLRINLALGPAAAERLAYVEHRGLVAFALADDDRAAHLESVQLFAHRLDGYLIGVLPFAIAHRARCRDGRFFRDTQKTDLETGFHDAPFVAKFGAQTLAEYG